MVVSCTASTVVRGHGPAHAVPIKKIPKSSQPVNIYHFITNLKAVSKDVTARSRQWVGGVMTPPYGMQNDHFQQKSLPQSRQAFFLYNYFHSPSGYFPSSVMAFRAATTMGLSAA